MSRMTPEKAKQALGVRQGKLSPCPDLNNCVCSQYPGKFYIEPIEVKDNKLTLKRIAEFIANEDGYKVVSLENNYLHITYTSGWFKFVDDIEFLLEGNKIIHVRSASRLGNWDLGANRKRVNVLKAKIPKLK